MALSTVSPSRWYRVFRPRPTATRRLVCFPHAGGSASVFHRWADRLPGSIELVAVQYPGRQDRRDEEPIGELTELADRVTSAVGPLFDRPVAFFGHSLGATIAFEVARRLSTPATRLTVSARVPPGDCTPSGYDFRRDEDLRRYLQRLGGAAMLAQDEELWQVAVPPLRADLIMSSGYRYADGPPLTCPITVIAALADHSCPMAAMRGWASHTVGAFDEHVLPGDHYYINSPTNELFTVLAGDVPAG